MPIYDPNLIFSLLTRVQKYGKSFLDHMLTFQVNAEIMYPTSNMKVQFERQYKNVSLYDKHFSGEISLISVIQRNSSFHGSNDTELEGLGDTMNLTIFIRNSSGVILGSIQVSYNSNYTTVEITETVSIS